MKRIALALAALLLTAAAPADQPSPPNARTVLDAVAAAGFSGELLVSGPKSLTRATTTPTTGPEPIWRWASVTKQVVAVLAMQEVERGRLQLDQPVARYAPTLPIANADRVTIRQLLQHTSGIGNVDDGPTRADGWPLYYLRVSPAPASGLAPACLGPAKAPPPAPFAYNNCDTDALGVVLETVTGKPLAALIAERITRPLGMTRTRLLRPGDDAGRPGFDKDGRDDRDIDVGRFGAGGGMAGPASDLARFSRALIDGRLLKPESRAELWRGNPKLGYLALAQWSYTVPLKGCATPQPLVERRGEIGGVQVRNVIAPDRGIAVIAFTDRPVDFGEPWQGKGVTYQLLSAALCPAS